MSAAKKQTNKPTKNLLNCRVITISFYFLHALHFNAVLFIIWVTTGMGRALHHIVFQWFRVMDIAIFSTRFLTFLWELTCSCWKKKKNGETRPEGNFYGSNLEVMCRNSAHVQLPGSVTWLSLIAVGSGKYSPFLGIHFQKKNAVM